MENSQNEKKKSEKQGLYRFMRHLIVYLPPLFGLFMLFKLSNKDWFGNSEVWSTFFISISVAMITGGILTLTANSLKFFNFFRVQLEEIVFGTDFLEKRNDIDELWSKISRIIYNKKFPLISERLENLIKQKYFPTKYPFYSDIFDIQIEFKTIDDEEDFVEVIESHKQCIICHGNEKFPIKFSSDVNLLENGGEDNLSDIELLEYKVNGILLLSKDEDNYQKGKNVDVKKDGIKMNLTYFKEQHRKGFTGQLEFSGSEHYEVEKIIRKKYSLKTNPTKSLVASHIVKRFIVFIMTPDELRIEFNKAGTIENYKNISTTNKNNYKYEYENILLPGQGFFIGITKN